MSSNPSLTITSTPNAGSFTINQSGSNLPAIATRTSVVIIVNDILNTGAFNQHILANLDDSDVHLQTHTIGSNILTPGVATHVVMRYNYANGTSIVSNNLLLTLSDVPVRPNLQNGGARSEDKNISINPSLLGYTQLSTSDSYSTITKFIAYISKVGANTTSGFMVREVPITGYNNWYSVTTNELDNGQQYEFAIVAVNERGQSIISPTILLTPADTPAQMIAPVVYSELSDQRRRSVTEDDVSGDIVVYFKKPTDYDVLLGNNQRVTQYSLSEQEYQNVTVNGTTSLQPVGNPTVITLNVPAHAVTANSGATFELPGVPSSTQGELINSVRYNYRHVIPGSPSRLGKIYKYTVLGTNVNGNGPNSNESSEVVPFILPAAQTYTLEHNSQVDTNQTVTPLTTYNGKMSILVNSLSSVNGGKDSFIPNMTYPQFNDIEMFLNIKVLGSVNSIFNGKVRLVQTINSVTTGVPPNQTTTHTQTGNYVLDFDNVDTDLGQSGIQTLNSLLVIGNKYRFDLIRKSTDPFNSAYEFSSISSIVERTKFSSPERINKIQAYAVTDTLTTVSTDTQLALRLVFEQLLTIQFNGMNTFNSTTEYRAFENSSIVPNLDPISHDSQITGIREFLVPQQSLGNNTNLYIRGRSFNPELNVWVDHTESTPSVQDACFRPAAAVTNLTITKPSADSVSVSFTKQPNAISLGGSNSSNVQNRIVLFANSGSQIAEHVVPHNRVGNIHTENFSSLSPGTTYIVSVIAETLYTKPAHDGNQTKRFNNSIIRENSRTLAFVASGVPGPLQNVEVLPSNGRFDILWDDPQNFAGLNPVNTSTHFYLNEDNTEFPASNVSVADAAGSSTVSLLSNFRTKATAVNRSNLVSIRNDFANYFSARVIGTVGGHTLSTTTLTNTVNNNFNGSTISTNHISTANPTVPVETVNGDLIQTRIVYASDSVPTPVVTVGASEEKLTVVVDKNIDSNVSDLVIILDENDVGVDAFDTRQLRSDTTGGLFILEGYVQNPGSYIPSNNGPTAATLAAFVTKFSFTRSLVNLTQFKYNIIFTGLTNGTTYNLKTRFARYETNRPLGHDKDTFGPAVQIARAPEAPPTNVRSPIFTVASTLINLSWTGPANNGGAGIGGNSTLSYRILLLDSADTILRTSNVSTLSTQITGLTNNTNYKVQIAAYYTKSDFSEVVGSYIQVNNVSGNLIRVNPEPLSPASVTINSGNNSISGTILTATQPATYPLSAINVYIRHKLTPTNSLLVQTFSNPGPGVNLTISAVSDFTIFSGTNGGLTSLGGHNRPLNGFAYEVVVESVVNYTYAQAPPTVLRDANPAGALAVTSITNPQGPAGNKQARVVCNLNGTGPIQNIVVLAKGTGNSIVVQNLSAGTLPTINPSGVLDNIAGVAANQTATFDITMTAVSGNVSDILVVVVSQNSSDTGVSPTGGSSFFD